MIALPTIVGKEIVPRIEGQSRRDKMSPLSIGRIAFELGEAVTETMKGWNVLLLMEGWNMLGLMEGSSTMIARLGMVIVLKSGLIIEEPIRLDHMHRRWLDLGESVMQRDPRRALHHNLGRDCSLARWWAWCRRISWQLSGRWSIDAESTAAHVQG